MMKTLAAVALMAVQLLGMNAHAQSVGSALDVQAYAMNGERFAAKQVEGKVAIVFFWSTTCAVCRDSLPELRANLAGWSNKPFALVTVNVDRTPNDWLSYERILAQTKAPTKGLISVRQDDGKPLPAKLPMTLLIDTKGKVVRRYEGRVAPEAWDDVAELLL